MIRLRSFYIILITCLSICFCLDNCRDYDEHPVVLVSFDGFRYDYLQRKLTPNINAFRKAGITVPYMKASYPTLTYPNHYTIVTGLYPESHGIVDNKFYDPEFNEKFSIGGEISLQSRWWGGDPIWNTVVQQGKKSATFFWPGSDINGTNATYWYPYDDSIPFEDRVNQVLEWLTMPADMRPIWICVYFKQPDHSGHEHGPDSPQVRYATAEMDRVFKSLIDGIAEKGLTNCVNVILLADHGMTMGGEEKNIYLEDIDPNINNLATIWPGSFLRMNVPNKRKSDYIRQEYTCQLPQLRQYDPEALPTRYHYSNNKRIGQIVFDMDAGYYAKNGGYDTSDTIGKHGYDNYYPDMQPIFTAGGPDFKSGFEAEVFQNIEIYNLMCHMVGIEPSPNNGTIGSLYTLLKNPPAYPKVPTETFQVAAFPNEDDLQNRLGISGCSGDTDKPASWIYSLNMSEEARNLSEIRNVPWGIPHDGNLPADILILHQDDHVTGFSQKLKMPLWSSFTVDSLRRGSSPSSWSSDVRLTSDNTPTCESYEHLLKSNISMEPLFPRRYSDDSTDRHIPYIVSNAIPMTSGLRGRWSTLLDDLLWDWFESTNYEPINIVVGPLFDNNADSLVDNFETFKRTPEVPSDVFLIVTRCLIKVRDLVACDPQNLDVMSFIYPERDPIPNCQNATDYALMFSARVKDVEIATGLSFYPLLQYQDKMGLEIRIHSSLWN